jgi:bla regulator protein BlaR1
MTFPVINSQLTDQLIKALCNTLVHSLWQGLLLAAIAGLIVIFTKRASSALRYNLLISALLLFTIGTIVTFGLQLQQVHYTTANEVGSTVQQNTFVAQTFNGNVNIQPASFTATITGYLNTYHNSIVLIWFLIICAKSIQLGVGLYGTYRLKRANVFAAGSYWNERMQQLACLLGIRQTISLMESGIAKVPMVIGHLKPVILIPIGLLTALSAEEVEAILVHELAHIKRRDYLVNMLQSLMEIVFFFNPAVLWLSQLIKTERENCCDDMALEQSNNKVNYIRALVSCEEYQSAVPAYAMAFPGSKNSLLDRVKRLATNRNHSLNLFEKTLLAICLVVSGLCVSAFAEKENIRKAVHEVVKAFEHTNINKVEQDKLAGQNALLRQQTAMIRQNTKLLQVRSAGMETVDDTTRKLRQPVNVNITPLNVQVPNVNVNVNPLTVQVPNVNVHLAPLNVQSNVNVHLDPLNVHLDPMNVSLGKVDTNYRGRGAAANKTFREIARELFKQHLVTDTNSITINLNEHELIVNGVKQSDEVHKQVYEKYGKGPGSMSFGYATDYSKSNSYNSSNSTSGSNSNSYSNTYSSTYPNPPTPKYHNPNNNRDSSKRYNPAPKVPFIPKSSVVTSTPDFGEELLKAKLITDKNNYTVQLNNKELIVNGVKQSEENHQLFLKKYAKNSGDKVDMNYSYHNSKNSVTKP